MSFFQYNNNNCWYEEFGTGTPLLLLHGNTASSKMFGGIVAPLRQHFKVILIDFLGHGKSQRLKRFPTELWYEEAQQVITFLEQKKYRDVSLLGCSGGALVAINVALERPALVKRLIADSFEGEKPIKAFTANIVEERDASKRDPGAIRFYQMMQGDDWESVVDNDTQAMAEHAKTGNSFFHQPLSELKAEILLTGSMEDEFITAVASDFYEATYGAMIQKIGHGTMNLFAHGGHPAMMSNQNEFIDLAKNFLR